MLLDKNGRHYWFAKYLVDSGYDVTIFCANNHNIKTNEQMFESKDLYVEKMATEINTQFIYVRAKGYNDNGRQRIANMLDFYYNLKKTAKKYARLYGKPDTIIASSVHPLTMVAGLKIAKKFRIPCICEIRDLWPEAIFKFGKLKEKSFFGKLLIKGEHWIYKKANALIFTKEGDTDYLVERKWTTDLGGDIDLRKCYYINNGINVNSFVDNSSSFVLDDYDLNNDDSFKVIYTGAVRPVNNVGNILDAAKLLMIDSKYKKVRFLVFGGGSELQKLNTRVKNEHINNVVLKGYVERKYIPFILSKGNVNLLNYSQKEYNWTRGNSSNKLFEYMASGKPIISTVHMGYSIINKYNCGTELKECTPECLAEEVRLFYNMNSSERNLLGTNALIGAKDFDFALLTKKLISVIEAVHELD